MITNCHILSAITNEVLFAPQLLIYSISIETDRTIYIFFPDRHGISPLLLKCLKKKQNVIIEKKKLNIQRNSIKQLFGGLRLILLVCGTFSGKLTGLIIEVKYSVHQSIGPDANRSIVMSTVN